ncbi:hypothetical protein, partial [Acidithiobacillus ferriphilus]|uniref:hypothetical protein n=1 Tax=Acidithiobacillus ferriphilus TaxID=1689834 RepID=UPI001C074A49
CRPRKLGSVLVVSIVLSDPCKKSRSSAHLGQSSSKEKALRLYPSNLSKRAALMPRLPEIVDQFNRLSHIGLTPCYQAHKIFFLATAPQSPTRC